MLADIFNRFFYLWIIIVVHISGQQFNQSIDYTLFTDSSGVVNNSFSGGHNNIKTQFVDIDGDGDKDLIFLDGDGTFGWYKNEGTPQIPEFILNTTNLPGAELRDWFYFADIDADGDYDLFTGNVDNFIKFYKNTGTIFSPKFALETDTLRSNLGEPIISESSCNPAFADVDADGDLDFISGNSIGTLSFYKNIGGAQNFSFEFVTDTWLNIIIIGGGFTAKHGASAIHFGDLDGDGDLDMLWGDFFGKSVYYLENTGSPVNAAYSVRFSTFPQNADSIITSGFNMPRLVDMDADGDLDLFISVLYDPTVPQVLLYYENIGTTTGHDLRLAAQDFLHTLDTGIQSYLSMVDIDGDGRKDIFISNARNPNGSIVYYRNIGVSGNTKFELTSSMFANITGELSLSAEFADLDADGDFDILLGNFNGTLTVYTNIGSSLNPLFDEGVQFRDSEQQTIDVGIYAKPRLADFDGDGDLDLMIGAFNGRTRVYRNIGSAVSFSFMNADSLFNLPDVGDNSSPFLFDFNKDGKPDLFIGNKDGNIWYFENTGSSSTPVWQPVTTDFLPSLLGIDITPYLVDYDFDGDFDLLAGNYKGGLYLYLNNEIVSVKEEIEIMTGFEILKCYPNPFNPSVTVEYNAPMAESVDLDLYDITGRQIRQIHSGHLPKGLNRLIVDFSEPALSGNASGVYLLRLQNRERTIYRKIMFMK